MVKLRTADDIDPLNRHLRLFTNHALVLLSIAACRNIRLKDIASQLNITERAVQRIVRVLADAGYLAASKNGQRKTYTINTDQQIILSNIPPITVESLLHFNEEEEQDGS